MSLRISDREFEAILALAGPERYAHHIKRVADTEQLWSLAAPGGWVLASDGRREPVPIWPHPRYAAACATNTWKDAEPSAIRLDDWLTKWLPGIARDGRAIAAFATPTDRAVVVESERMRADLEAELEHYE